MKTFDFHREYTPTKPVDINSLLKDGTMITGGHFTFMAGKPALNQGTLMSFVYSVHAYQISRRAGVQTRLGILINDIGQVCGAEHCSIRISAFDRKNFTLPDAYLLVLKENGVPLEDITIFWEKFIRNRGKKELKKALRGNIAVQKDGDRFKPRLIIDLATLTGAIMVALGKEYAGLFSNDDTLAE